jgi:hypothetical protein
VTAPAPTETVDPGGQPPPERAGRGPEVALLIVALAVVTVAVASVHAIGVGFDLSYEPRTSRVEAISGRSGRVAVWAVATPACAWVVAQARHVRLVGLAAWVALLVWCGWWWVPPAPTGTGDTDMVLWHSAWGLPAWALTATVLGVVVDAARRTGRYWEAAGYAFAVLVAGVAIWSVVRVGARVEDSMALTTLPDADAELAALAADPLWDALHAGTARHATGAYETPWGERHATSMSRTLPGDDTEAVFVAAAAAAAEDAGWLLIGTFCSDDRWDAEYVKQLPTGPASLQISRAPWQDGVDVTMVATDPFRSGEGPCWPE